MIERERVIQDLIEELDAMIDTLASSEIADSDFTIARELAEQLKEELEILSEE